MTGNDLMIEVAGLRMFGRPGRGPYVVKSEGLEGWEDGVDMRSESVAVPNRHGSYVLPRFQESRTVGVQGVILAKTARELANFRAGLTGLLAHGRPGRMQVTVDGSTQWGEVMLASKTKVTRRRGTYYADFSLNLWAPDARKFGAVQSVPAGVGSATPVQNRGNYPASPVIVVAGPVSAGGYSVTGPGGEVFTVTTSPAAGVTHLINMHDGLLRVNGSISAGAGLVSRADTFTIPPGGKVNVILSKGGRVELYDTYI